MAKQEKLKSFTLMMVHVTEDDIKNSPEYQPCEAISESYEANLQNYYGDLIY